MYCTVEIGCTHVQKIVVNTNGTICWPTLRRKGCITEHTDTVDVGTSNNTQTYYTAFQNLAICLNYCC